MLTLTLIQFVDETDKYRVGLRLTQANQLLVTADAHFKLSISSRELEEIRWYLEDFLQYPLNPTPLIAKRIEQRMSEIGVELFKSVFESNEETRYIWSILSPQLEKSRIEIVTNVHDAPTIPWELLREPQNNEPIAISSRAFVRVISQPEQGLESPYFRSTLELIRILLVICRPEGGSDVPFRSVANQLIKSINDNEIKFFQLDVLRPPTFEQLSNVLNAATERREPYHIVHFDGHGVYEDILTRFTKQLPQRKRGYLVFENPMYPTKSQENEILISGDQLGRVLVRAKVPLLILNACRSAHAESPEQPGMGIIENQTQTFGSFAQEALNEGLMGVVAMRYSVYVSTAANFVANLYTSLAQGQTLGESVTSGRRQLYSDPFRTIGYDPYPLQDWVVPIVYERQAPILSPKPKFIHDGGIQHPQLVSPDVTQYYKSGIGFFGRDETLLALDRAFDNKSIVLLHGYAGSGKTATTVEFAHWYTFTGGIKGHVLFTSFERYKPLAQVINQLGQLFIGALESKGIQWLSLDDNQRKIVALQILSSIPIMWIWDNIEPITGFPKGNASDWSHKEQLELVEFLGSAQNTKAKLLLTSRRDERDWLGELPYRITIPPMPMQERIELTHALTEKRGKRFTDIEDWRALLRFTLGNPLTINILVSQVLRDGLKTREEIETFITQLRVGEAKFEKQISEGRTTSLEVSLSYGFEHAFHSVEHKQIALLYLFQEFVDAKVFQQLSEVATDDSTLNGQDLDRNRAIFLLDRAAEIGMLTAIASGYYVIHPAVPGFFKRLFDYHYASREDKVIRIFVESLRDLAFSYYILYEQGNHYVIGILRKHEQNILHAIRFALANTWLEPIHGLMQGLSVLYEHEGRDAEWKNWLDLVLVNYVDLTTGNPLPGKEEMWRVMVGFQIRLAYKARQFPEAEKLLRRQLEVIRQKVALNLEVPLESLSRSQRNDIHDLAAGLDQLGIVLGERNSPGKISSHKQAIRLHKFNNDKNGEAIATYNLGSAYVELADIRDLTQAEYWIRESLKLAETRGDKRLLSRCNHQLGRIVYEQAIEIPFSKERFQLLENAKEFLLRSLKLFPSESIFDLATIHSTLGIIYAQLRDFDNALHHYREAIKYNDLIGDLHKSASACFNIALTLFWAGRFEDASEYAQAALSRYESSNNPDLAEMRKTKDLIELLKAQSSGMFNLPEVIVDQIEQIGSSEQIRLTVELAFKQILNGSPDARKAMMQTALPFMDKPKRRLSCRVDAPLAQRFWEYCGQKNLNADTLLTGSLIVILQSRQK